MARAFIINFTGRSGHWGMLGTSLALLEGLIDRGFDIATLDVDEVRTHFPQPTTAADLYDPAATAGFAERSGALVARMRDADVILVNGEGTLHALRPSSLNLLFLIRYAATELDRPVHLVNFSCFPQSHSPAPGAAGSVYAGALRSLGAPRHQVVVRDPVSGGILDELGVDHQVGFDCLPQTIARHYPGWRWQPGRRIVLSSGASLPNDAIALVAEQLPALVPDCDGMTYLSGGYDTFAAYERDRVLPAVASAQPRARLHLAPGLGDFLRGMADGSAILVTGRFHYAIAAACLGIPTVTLRSNSIKNAAIASVAGLPAPLTPDDLKDPARLRTAVAEALDGPRPRVRDLAALADVNFTGLPPAAAGRPAEPGTERLYRLLRERL